MYTDLFVLYMFVLTGVLVYLVIQRIKRQRTIKLMKTPEYYKVPLDVSRVGKTILFTIVWLQTLVAFIEGDYALYTLALPLVLILIVGLLALEMVSPCVIGQRYVALPDSAFLIDDMIDFRWRQNRKKTKIIIDLFVKQTSSRLFKERALTLKLNSSQKWLIGKMVAQDVEM